MGMSWLPLSFGTPIVLFGLLALPVIWWLLRFTPPKPQTELFPPLKILARVLKREETPQQSPWWLTLLRLLMAALVIMALAEPVLNPREKVTTGGEALALVIDNGWASAPDWDKRVATARRLIADAGASDLPVIVAFTAEKSNADIGPFDANAALDRLRATAPRPIPTDRQAVYARVAETLGSMPGASIAVLSDGLEAPGDDEAFRTLLERGAANLVWATPERIAPVALTASENEVDGFSLTAIRAPGNPAPSRLMVGAFDDKGRRIADAALTFGTGENEATATMAVPFELRNDFASIAIDGERHAGAVRVLDEGSKRRRVGLISQSEADQAQPLLSPLYYIRRALSPFADLIEPSNPDLAEAIPQILEQKPAMIVMSDVGTMPEQARLKLTEWVEGGGTLVRFAGPRLANAGIGAGAGVGPDTGTDDLLPVRLRSGERSFGGALSWTTPQPVTEFPASGPFAGLTPPREVTVTRQVLAEPSPDIVDRTWASLADGTPLVTGAKRGKGTIALFHIAPTATWSNLPISGSFVEMLQRVVQLSRNQGSIETTADTMAAALAPYRMIAADGALVPPSPEARPLTPATRNAVTMENPPGLYGSEAGVLAHNLLSSDSTLTPIRRPQAQVPVTDIDYAFDESSPLKGPFIAAALALMALDTLAVFWMGGAMARRARSGRNAAAAASMLVLFALPVLLAGNAFADDARPDDAMSIDAISTTRLAYVITGVSSVDAISRAGMQGLSRFLVEKTALEPGEPAGVDIAKDELAFYPLIYWPIDPAAPMPDEDAIARIDAYMRQGGTVLFDTRDEYSSGFGEGATSPATQRLRDILGNLNVPPLEPVPADHVLTKSFYMLPEFPGRFNGSPMWVEASLDASNIDNRPVRTGDGVSPILITANDLAGAWAIDADGGPLLPTVPPDPMQRVHALRGGVNIMMYMLTGNYKSDQVHVPILLERLGQ
ncbi:putative membrane protein (TIGR02226 family) [Aquamicrobium defluvii]|nr:putative membrane protein (TIGR02226 family) [Aquamicrobium defluvii]